MLALIWALAGQVQAGELWLTDLDGCLDEQALESRLERADILAWFDVDVVVTGDDGPSAVRYEVRCEEGHPRCDRCFPSALSAEIALFTPEECETVPATVRSEIRSWAQGTCPSWPFEEQSPGELQIVVSAAPSATVAPRGELVLAWHGAKQVTAGVVARGLVGAPVAVPQDALSYCVGDLTICERDTRALYVAAQAGVGMHARHASDAFGVSGMAMVGPIMAWGAGFERNRIGFAPLVDLSAQLSVRLFAGLELLLRGEVEPVTAGPIGDLSREPVALPPLRTGVGVKVPLAPR